MKKLLIIFGCGEFGEVAHFYFSRYSNYEVAAFTVDSSHLEEPVFCGLPVIPFESLLEAYTPDIAALFVAIGYDDLNAARKRKFFAAKDMGYEIASYVSSKATLWSGLEVGQNWFILENNLIQPFAKLGDNVIMYPGNFIGHHSSIDEHTYISANVTIGGGTHIGERCFLGLGSKLRDHIRIGARSVIGVGANVMHDTEPDSIYAGIKARKIKAPSNRLKHL